MIFVDCEKTAGRLAAKWFGSFVKCKPRRPPQSAPADDPVVLGADAETPAAPVEVSNPPAPQTGTPPGAVSSSTPDPTSPAAVAGLSFDATVMPALHWVFDGRAAHLKDMVCGWPLTVSGEGATVENGYYIGGYGSKLHAPDHPALRSQSWALFLDYTPTATIGSRDRLATSQPKVGGDGWEILSRPRENAQGMLGGLCWSVRLPSQTQGRWSVARVGFIANPGSESDQYCKGEIETPLTRTRLYLWHDAAAQRVILCVNGQVSIDASYTGKYIARTHGLWLCNKAASDSNDGTACVLHQVSWWTQAPATSAPTVPANGPTMPQDASDGSVPTDTAGAKPDPVEPRLEHVPVVRSQAVGIFWTPLLCLPDIEAQAGAALRKARTRYNTLLCVVDLALNTRNYIQAVVRNEGGNIRPNPRLIENLRYLQAGGWRVIVTGANEPSTRKGRSKHMGSYGFADGQGVDVLYSDGCWAGWAWFWSEFLATESPWAVMPLLEPFDARAVGWAARMAGHIRQAGFKGHIYQSGLGAAQARSDNRLGLYNCTSRAGTAGGNVNWERFWGDELPMRDGDDWDYGRDRRRIPELVASMKPDQHGCIPLYVSGLTWDDRMLEGL